MSHDVDEPDQAYQYLDKVRYDILRMIPDDGVDIGSFGCGKAATEAVLVSHGRRVHGVDTSPEAINVARNRLTSARVVHADDEACFEDESIDGLILADVIEHLPRAWDRLTRMTRWVKPGGWVVISVPNMRNYRVLATFVIRGEWPEEQTGIFDQTHVQVITKRRLTRWCESAGLRCEGCSPVCPRDRRGGVDSSRRFSGVPVEWSESGFATSTNWSVVECCRTGLAQDRDNVAIGCRRSRDRGITRTEADLWGT